MSSVIWIQTLNSIIASGKQQIVLQWLHLQWHLNNTRNSTLTASTTLLDTHAWQKPKQDMWNRRRNLSVRARLWSAGDFAGNYQYLIQDDIQSFQWSKEYCTLHPLVIYSKIMMETSNIIHSVSFQMTTHITPVLFTRFTHYWWNFWSRGSRTSQRSIKFLMVVVGNIKISRTSLIYVPIKSTFQSKQSGFSLQLQEITVWWWCSETPCCKAKFAEINQQPNSGLSWNAESMPRRNEINYLLWYWHSRHGRGEREDREEVRRW